MIKNNSLKAQFSFPAKKLEKKLIIGKIKDLLERNLKTNGIKFTVNKKGGNYIYKILDLEISKIEILYNLISEIIENAEIKETRCCFKNIILPKCEGSGYNHSYF
jgi:hypothetical protein